MPQYGYKLKKERAETGKTQTLVQPLLQQYCIVKFIDPKLSKEEVATLLLLVINRGLKIYEIYGVPSYGLPCGENCLAVIGPKYPLSLVARW